MRYEVVRVRWIMVGSWRCGARLVIAACSGAVTVWARADAEGAYGAGLVLALGATTAGGGGTYGHGRGHPGILRVCSSSRTRPRVRMAMNIRARGSRSGWSASPGATRSFRLVRRAYAGEGREGRPQRDRFERLVELAFGEEAGSGEEGDR